VRRPLLAISLAVSFVLGAPAVARADAVDDAFAEGNAAAAKGDWASATSAYERAAALLPVQSDVLEYDLGTAYAHGAQLGRATFHLRRALRETNDPQLREAARRNLGVVRRRAELQAATVQTRLSPAPGWRERLWLALGAPGVGILGLALGWACVALAAVRWFWRRRASPAPFDAMPLIIALAVAFGTISVAHGLALRTDPEAIVLDAAVDVHEGPGRHREVAFTLQGGASVRLIGQAPGWHEVRVGGGLRGWVPREHLGVLDAERTPLRASSSPAPRPARPAEPGS